LALAGLFLACRVTAGGAQGLRSQPAEEELRLLAHAPRKSKSASTYSRLKAFAALHSGEDLGARAALALGYYDYTQRRYAEAERWFARAENDSLLREYGVYWGAIAHRARGDNARALPQLEAFRRDFPESVMIEQAVEALAEAALALGRPERALEALATYRKVETKPALLLLRAQANERSERVQSAAADYAAVYYGFPLSEEAKKASGRIGVVRRALGAKFPGVPPGQQLARAEALYDRHLWRDARAEFSRLLPLSRGADRDRAGLRVAQCRVALHASPSVLASLRLSDPAADAERLAALARWYSVHHRERELLDTTERLAAQYPSSRWAEDALAAAGHFFWAQLDRRRAAEYYRRVLARFPSGNSARMAHWRVAWAAYLESLPEAAELLEEHLRRFPGSPFAPDALYWLGRSAERGGGAPGARNFYAQLIERFPENYFARQAAQRMRGLGPGPASGPELLSLLPRAAAPAALNEAVPQAAAGPWKRAQALRTIAFDASAELELRAAYAKTGAPRLLLEAAHAELAAGHVLSAIATAREVFPELESRRLEEGPEDAWRLVYPLVFQDLLEREASRAELDPMLVAGLIRQETAFQPEAVSPAGAVGLMQLRPRTAQRLARRLKLRYSRARLLQPEYNLRLGTAYLADLARRYGVLEAALATYNAGEDHVAEWQAERSYEEPAEFVESIPFRETHDYVLLVIRNAGIYRRLYGKRP